MIRNAVLSLLAVAFIATPAGAVPAKSDYTPEQALSYSQAAIGRSLADYQFTDADGDRVHMSDYQGKPLVVSFIYTSCADSCPILTQTLADAVDVARSALGGESFNIVTIGFDSAADTSDRMRYFATSNGIKIDGWKFLSGDLGTVTQFSEQTGFIFYRSAKGFDHLSQVTVIDADGVIYRQIYGEIFEAPRLVEPLKELVFGTASPFASFSDLINKVRLFCTIYDPAAGRYRFDYSIFIQLIVGSLIVGSLGIFVTRQWWRIYKQHRGQNRPVTHT